MLLDIIVNLWLAIVSHRQ